MNTENFFKRARVIARAVYFCLLPAAATAGGLALAPLIGMSGFASLSLKRLRPSTPAMWGLLAFAGWASLSALWSRYPDHGQALRFLATLGPGIIFAAAAEGRRAVQASAVAALVVMSVMLGIEAFANMPLGRAIHPDEIDWVLARNPAKGISIFVVLLWPVLAMLFTWGKAWSKFLAVALFGVGAALSPQFGMDANLAAFVAGLIGMLAGATFPRLGVKLAAFGCAAWLLVAPWVTSDLIARVDIASLPQSWEARASIWRFAIDRIRESPWIGHGMDASRSFTDTITVGGETMHALPLHPHSASLQIWLETGAIGAALAAIALVLAGIELSRAPRPSRMHASAACATIASIGTIANLSFGAWQEWWIATICTSAALLAALHHLRFRSQGSR